MRKPSKLITKSRINEYFVKKQAQMIMERGDAKVTVSEVEIDVANHCGITRQTVMSLKKAISNHQSQQLYCWLM